MLKQLPLKKEYLLIGGALILLLVCYRFAFTKTIAAWQVNSQLKTKLAQAADLSFQPGYLERKNRNLDRIINLYKADTSVFRSNIISTIASIAEKENVKLIEVPISDVSFHTDHFIIEKLDFEGDYFALIRTVQQLNITDNIGVIRSEDWRILNNRSGASDVKKLVLEIYLEVVR